MKAKVILYGWAISWLFLLAGADTMEYGNFAAGLLLFAVWVVFSLLLIGNEKACGEEADRFDAWMDKVMLWLTGGSDKDKVSIKIGLVSVCGPRYEGGIPDSSVR